VNELIGKHGGQALLPRGEGDAGGSEMFNDFDSWEDLLFKKLTEVISLMRSVCLVAYILIT
jgi:cytochrome P450/NADPH-cytochrome P450 reductase